MSVEEKYARGVQQLTEKLGEQARQLFGIIRAQEGEMDAELRELLLTQVAIILRSVDELKCRQSECLRELEEQTHFLNEALASQRLMLEDYMLFVKTVGGSSESDLGISTIN